jgi:hypothetical protein
MSMYVHHLGNFVADSGDARLAEVYSTLAKLWPLA